MTDQTISFIRARGSTTSHRLVEGVLLCGESYPRAGTISGKSTGIECPWCRYAAEAVAEPAK